MMRARCERCDASEWQVLRRESEDFLFQPDVCVQEVLYKNYVPPTPELITIVLTYFCPDLMSIIFYLELY